MSRVHALPGCRLAIRVGDRLLSVPPMHPATPRTVRVQVFELVLRRLWGEALELATATADDIDRRSRGLQQLNSIMAQTPHRNTRGIAA